MQSRSTSFSSGIQIPDFSNINSHTRSKDHISQWCSSSNPSSSPILGSSPIPYQHPRLSSAPSGHRSRSGLTVNSISLAPSNSQAAPLHTTVQRSLRRTTSTPQSTPTPNPASTIVVCSPNYLKSCYIYDQVSC
jgi:hypothetical protein